MAKCHMDERSNRLFIFALPETVPLNVQLRLIILGMFCRPCIPNLITVLTPSGGAMQCHLHTEPVPVVVILWRNSLHHTPQVLNAVVCSRAIKHKPLALWPFQLF